MKSERLFRNLRLSRICGVLLFVSFGFAAEPPPELADRYEGHRELIGYPTAPLVRGKKHGDADWLPYMRMRTVKHRAAVTTEEAARLAKEIADTGFNVVISEDSRYLLRETDDKVAPGETDTVGLPFPDLVRNTRRLVDAFHKEGVRFIGHLTCAQVAFTYAEKHPGQQMVDINTGKPCDNKNYGLAYMCYVNPDFWRLYLQRVSDFIEATQVDGLMVDEIQTFYANPNGCGCAACRAKFKTDTGIELPPNSKPADWFHPKNPDYHRWMKWRAEQVVLRQNEIRDVLRKKRGPHAMSWAYMSNLTYPAAYYNCSLNADVIARYADVQGIEVECEGEPRLYTYYWRNNAVEFKVLQAFSAHRSGVSRGLFYSTFPHDFTWNHLLGLSLGIKHWWSWQAPSDAPSWQPLLAWETKHEELLAHRQPFANIGVVFSNLTQDHHPLNAGSSELPFGYVNFCNALMDSGIVFRAVTDRDLDEGTLDGMETIALPHVALMSDRALGNLRAFVTNGGTLVTTGETARWDENGRERADRSFGSGKVIALPGRPELAYATQHLGFGAPLVKPGEAWEDKRDEKARETIVKAVLTGAAPKVTAENLRRGIFLNATTQKHGTVHNTIVTLANFLGVEIKTGAIPRYLDPVFPQAGGPFVVSAEVPATKAVYLVSPDYPQPVEMPFEQVGKRVRVPLARLDRLAMLVFVHGTRDLVRELEGGAIVKTQPQPVTLAIRDVPALAGAYDPEAVGAFVGHDTSFEGAKETGRYKQQPCRILYGARSPFPQVKATLKLEKIPARPTLTVGGMDDNWPAPHKAPIEILVNGTSVFKGPSEFPDNEWAARSFPIPDGALKVGDNEVLIKNLGDSASPSTPPWFGVTFLKIAEAR
jgi:hypothetical protein